MNQTLLFLAQYGAYLLGALILILDLVKKYEDVANANPDPNIVYKKKSFWAKERWNILQIALLGVVSVLILPAFFGGSTFALHRSTGEVAWSIPMKAALIPLQIVIGWTGGRAILAIMGKTKGELYEKVGIKETKTDI